MKYLSSFLLLNISAMNAMDLPYDAKKLIAWQCIEMSPNLPSMSRTICAVRATNKDFCRAIYDLTGAFNVDGTQSYQKTIEFIHNYVKVRFPALRCDIIAQRLPFSFYAAKNKQLSDTFDCHVYSSTMSTKEVITQQNIDPNYTWKPRFTHNDSVEWTQQCTWSPLLYAVKQNNEPMIDLLLERGACIDMALCVQGCFFLKAAKSKALLIKFFGDPIDASIMLEPNKSLADFITQKCDKIYDRISSEKSIFYPIYGDSDQKQLCEKQQAVYYSLLHAWNTAFVQCRKEFQKGNCSQFPEGDLYRQYRITQNEQEYLVDNFKNKKLTEIIELYVDNDNYRSAVIPEQCSEVVDGDGNTFLHIICSKIDLDVLLGSICRSTDCDEVHWGDDLMDLQSVLASILSREGAAKIINVQNNKGYTPLSLLMKNFYKEYQHPAVKRNKQIVDKNIILLYELFVQHGANCSLTAYKSGHNVDHYINQTQMKINTGFIAKAWSFLAWAFGNKYSENRISLSEFQIN